MRRVLAVVVVFFAIAVCVELLIARWRDHPSVPVPPTFGPAIPAAIKLPESSSGQPISASVENAIYLHINRDGEVIHPFNRTADQHSLTTADEVEEYLKQRAAFEKSETGKKRPEGTLILRIDRETPFEKVYPILQAAYAAYYENYQLRVLRPSGSVEAAIPLTLERNYGGAIVCSNDEQPKQLVMRVTATDAGQIAGLCLREYGATDEESDHIGTDLAVCEKKLTAFLNAEKKRIERGAAKGAKIPAPELRFEIAGKLQQQSVMQLLDIGLHAGFTQAWFVPIDSAVR